METVPLDTGGGKPSAVPSSNSCTCPVGATPVDVTVTLNAKLFAVEGNFAALTESDVCVATAPPPPPPPLPPPHPSVRLKTETNARPSALICFRSRNPGSKNSNIAPNPMLAPNVHQPLRLAFSAFDPPGGSATTVTYCEVWLEVREADKLVEGAATEMVSTPVAGVAPVTVMVKGFGVQLTPGGNPVPAQVICTSPGVAPAPGVAVMVETPLPPAVTVTGVAVIV